METYLTWRRENGEWIGRTATGKDVVAIASVNRGPTRKARLRRLTNDTAEICASIRHAKDYANELVRLWNYQPIREKVAT